MICWNLFFCIFVVVLFVKIECQTQEQEKQLYNDLFTNYTKELFPRRDPTKPLNVRLQFYLLALNEFKEVEEMISMIGVFLANWTDPSLTWDPTHYGNIYTININTKDMWLPSLFLINRVDKMEPVGHDINFQASLTFSGQIYYNPGDILNVKCAPDISKFPFDTQECDLEFMQWGVDLNTMVLHSVFDKADLSWYSPNADWSLQDYSTRTDQKGGSSLFYFKIKIKRQPLYYTVVIIFPTILFALLNPLVFVLPVESGERVSLAMTILLSYAIFLTIVSASIPASSNPMCILLVIMITIISISGIITCGAILSAKYYYMDDVSDVWSPLKTFAKWRLKKKHQHAILPEEEVDQKRILFSGKDISGDMDFLFFYGSYIVIFCIAAVYFICVTI